MTERIVWCRAILGIVTDIGVRRKESSFSVEKIEKQG
jgi:hypothetical protein